MSVSSNSFESLEELCRDRREWVDITRKNNFEAGIYKLLSEMYPDQAHFIYELLQNAEDANASVVKFELSQQNLVVTHNGKRLFNHDDVNSITSIGDTKKSDDINKIGKFGVGFKAVFAYTSKPQVHSGPYSFEITDLVCPSEIAPIEKKADETVFIFPFNNNKKNSADCFNEIEHVFHYIDKEVLLFLTHIERIEWFIEDSGKGDIQRIYMEDIDPDMVQISIRNSINSNTQKNSWFLRFQKEMPTYGKLQCGVALQLEFRKSSQNKLEKGKKLSEQMKIVPAQGKLFIFFPADKETTGLKFHINGPYSSTIDRASIGHDISDNKNLFSYTTELLKEVLSEIKIKSLLTVDFLDVLPNDDDDLKPFYDTLRETLYAAFKEHKLIPTQDGKFANSDELVRGSKIFSEFFNNEDLFFLSKGEHQKWVANVMRNARPDKFLKSLGVPRWGKEKLLMSTSNKFSQWVVNEEAKNWFIGKGINWIREFYLLLWTAASKEPIKLYRLEIILSENKELVQGKDAYFSPTGDSIDFGLIVVEKALLESIRSEKKDRLKSFLKAAGVNEIGEREALENILEKYYTTGSLVPSRKQHKEHINRFISWSRKSRDYSLFEDYCIFFDINKKLQTTNKFFLDKPICKTGLTSIQNYTKQVPLWTGYTEITDFDDFARGAGVRSELTIKQVEIHSNHPDHTTLKKDEYAKKTHTGINVDFNIEGIDTWLKSPSIEIAELIWATMCRADLRVLKAQFRPNKQYTTKTAPSSLVYSLMNAAWMPAKDGKFYNPKEMSKSALCISYYGNGNGWLTAVKFGEEKLQANEEYIIKQQSAENLGISFELTEFVQEHLKEIEELKETIESKKVKGSFPSRNTKTSVRRKIRGAEQFKKSEKKRYEKKNRTVRTSKNAIDQKEYLFQQYTNDSGEMFCQLCQQALSGQF